MAWIALVDGNGVLRSMGDVPEGYVPPSGLEVVPIAGPPDFSSQMWDEATRSFVPRPTRFLIDRLDDFQQDAEFMQAWNNLSASRRTALRNSIIRIIGVRRWRFNNESVEIVGD